MMIKDNNEDIDDDKFNDNDYYDFYKNTETIMIIIMKKITMTSTMTTKISC